MPITIPHFLALLVGIRETSEAPIAATAGTFVIGILTIASSHKDNVAQPATKVPDTVQFWLPGSSAWRLRTYAVDHDVHTYAMGLPTGDPVAVARCHINRKYGGVLARNVILPLWQGTQEGCASPCRRRATWSRGKGPTWCGLLEP